MSQPQQTEQNNAEKATTDSVVGKIAHAIENTLSTGDLAQLRRISPEEPFTPALWKLLLEFVPEPWVQSGDRDENERRWAALFMGMAMTAGLHNPSVPLGRALAEAGWSELRFVRLMRDRGESLHERIRRVAAYLDSKQQEADWTDMAHLLRNQEGEWAEKHRRRISRDYYRALYEEESDES